MRTIYWAYSERYGEIEGMFDKDGTLLGFWAGNDACWRNEYFEPFMRALGFEVKPAPDWMIADLEMKAFEIWGDCGE